MDSKLRNLVTAALVSGLALHAPAQAAGTELGQAKKDLQALSAAIRNNPSDLQRRRMLVETFLALGMSRRAADEMEGLVKAGLRKPEDFALLADTYRFSGRLTSAIQNYQEALSISPNFGHARAGMALAYMQAGAKKTAESICKKALLEASDLNAVHELRDAMKTIKEAQSGNLVAMKVDSIKI